MNISAIEGDVVYVLGEVFEILSKGAHIINPYKINSSRAVGNSFAVVLSGPSVHIGTRKSIFVNPLPKVKKLFDTY